MADRGVFPPVPIVGGTHSTGIDTVRAIHVAIDNNDKQVAIVLYVGNRTLFVHTVNVTKGKFIDNYYGDDCKLFKTYHLRLVNKEDFINLNNIVNQAKIHIRSKCWLGWLFKEI